MGGFPGAMDVRREVHIAAEAVAVILSGEIDMLLDDISVHLKQGDVIVQQATNHAWVNHGTQPCRILFVLLDSKEP